MSPTLFCRRTMCVLSVPRTMYSTLISRGHMVHFFCCLRLLSPVKLIYTFCLPCRVQNQFVGVDVSPLRMSKPLNVKRTNLARSQTINKTLSYRWQTARRICAIDHVTVTVLNQVRMYWCMRCAQVTVRYFTKYWTQKTSKQLKWPSTLLKVNTCRKGAFYIYL